MLTSECQNLDIARLVSIKNDPRIKSAECAAKECAIMSMRDLDENPRIVFIGTASECRCLSDLFSELFKLNLK